MKEVSMKLLALAILAAVSPMRGQAPAEGRTAFEVASIKRHPEPVTHWSDPSVRGSRVVGTASTLLELIELAYGLRRDQISGSPGWAESDRYDITAKAEGEGKITPDELRRMLQALLTDRFQLKVHHEAQEAPIYALVVGKNGPKFKPSPPEADGHNFTRGTDKGLHMEMPHGTMQQLADQLSHTAGRPVVDRTGLTGYYAYTVDWFPANVIPPPDMDAPSMFAALQEQLGLRLESTKGPMEKLVIDHAEKPSEN
jgi:uncharacterized protein (TIGR03435 family)